MAGPHLEWRDDPSRSVALDPRRPLTIGRDPANRLSLPQEGGLSRRHAEVRLSRSSGWVICDLGSSNGTFLGQERVERCRPLREGDEIRLGRRGPVLVFRNPSPPVPSAPQPQARSRVAAGSIDFAGRSLPLAAILSADLRSHPRHPQMFSWWLLLCLGGLVLLPFPLLFWPLQAGALLAWIVFGSQRDHVLEVTLRDGMAHRHCFANASTALSHRNGIRRAIGQSLEP
jgi:hypothetical protein